MQATERENMKLADTTMESGFSFQQELLLQALERQALTGRLMTNPHVTGFTSFAKAVLNFINDTPLSSGFVGRIPL